MNANSESIPFFEIVQRLEGVLGHTTNILELIDLVSEANFLEIRSSIIAAFEVGEANEYSEVFGHAVEFGDISDAVREVTFRLYPQTTPMDMPISFGEREMWCDEILNTLDMNTSTVDVVK